jgi:ABC-type sugar transport system ATPase subunit
MDEPTAALGEREAAHALSLILALKGQGIAILLVTHRLTDLLQVADRIAIVSHGALPDRNDRIRIVSARPASRAEREQYEGR